WLKQRIEQDGFIYRQDGAGNQSAILPSTTAEAKTLLAGSHIDTVENGGRYDGALGVLSALEALRTIREANITRPVHLEAISFTDEEGSVLGEFGSMAFAGILTPEKLAHPRGGLYQLEQGMSNLGLTAESIQAAKRPSAELAGFVEVHIEQGTRLEDAGLDIGIVTAIVGIRSAWLTFTGEAAHAGTKPMHQRADALWGASQFIQQAKKRIMTDYNLGVMNCGFINASPGAFNIVPAEVRLALEFRHGSEAQLDDMQAMLYQIAQETAVQCGLEVNIETAVQIPAAPMSVRVVQAIAESATVLGLKHTKLLSFAGHDAQVISQVCPTAMIFVPSVDGISHNPKELTLEHDLINGANTLLHTLLNLAQWA
ncbi:MAG: M20 family metallo-hydrolase, partial [Sphaerospermopsis sp. SIO1G2]|nr:M20 family metallo-hydrolase [Sphaerospermopsis sp. SIO1G2]